MPLSRAGEIIYLWGLDLGAGGDSARARNAALGGERGRAGAGDESGLHFERREKGDRAREREKREVWSRVCSRSAFFFSSTSTTAPSSFFVNFF